VNQTATGIVAGELLIVLNPQVYLGCPDPKEWIVIEGQSKIDLTMKEGVHGDVATATMIVNCIPRVLNSNAGLMTTKHLPIRSGWFAIGDTSSGAEQSSSASKSRDWCTLDGFRA